MGYSRYIYSVARVRVLETRFLNKEVLSAVTAARSAEQAVKLIEQTGVYPMDILNIKDSQGLEVFCKAQLLQLDELAKGLLVDRDLYRALVLFEEDLAQSYSIIRKTRYDFLNDFFKRAVDLTNIKTFLRLRYRQAKDDDFKIRLIEGGCLGREYFLNFIRSDSQELREALKKTYYRALAESIDFSAIDFAHLERQIYNYLIDFIKPAKYISFGPEPIFAYLLAKTNEIVFMRLVIMSKLNGIDPGFIAKRMTESYA